MSFFLPIVFCLFYLELTSPRTYLRFLSETDKVRFYIIILLRPDGVLVFIFWDGSTDGGLRLADLCLSQLYDRRGGTGGTFIELDVGDRGVSTQRRLGHRRFFFQVYLGRRTPIEG